VAVLGCSGNGDSKPSLAELLVNRYGGDLACVEGVVKQADARTADGLREIAENGLDVQKWTEGPTLDALGRVMAC